MNVVRFICCLVNNFFGAIIGFCLLQPPIYKGKNTRGGGVHRIRLALTETAWSIETGGSSYRYRDLNPCSIYNPQHFPPNDEDITP